MSEGFFAEILVGVLGPLVIGVLFRWFEVERERKHHVVDAYQRYNTPDLLKARANGWHFLSGHYASHSQPWSIFYSDRRSVDGVDRQPFWEAHDDIVTVGTFWALLGVLASQGRLNDRMVRPLFRKTYAEWSIGFRHLRRETLAHGEQLPDWLGFIAALDDYFGLAEDERADILPLLDVAAN